MIKICLVLARSMLLLAAASLGAATDAADSRPLSLSYRLWAGGLQALSFDMRLDQGEDSYRISLAAQTEGLVGWLYPYSLQAEAAGSAGTDGVQPKRFRSSNRDGDEVEGLVITYQGDDSPRVEEIPPDGSPPDDKVPKRLSRGSLDPMSGVFSIIHTMARTGRCDESVPVFDGKRRYNLIARQIGEADLRSGGYGLYSGPAIRCRVEIERLAGFKEERGGYPAKVEVWLAPVVDGGSPVPVRLEADNKLGGLRAYLVAAKAAATRPAR